MSCPPTISRQAKELPTPAGAGHETSLCTELMTHSVWYRWPSVSWPSGDSCAVLICLDSASLRSGSGLRLERNGVGELDGRVQQRVLLAATRQPVRRGQASIDQLRGQHRRGYVPPGRVTTEGHSVPLAKVGARQVLSVRLADVARRSVEHPQLDEPRDARIADGAKIKFGRQPEARSENIASSIAQPIFVFTIMVIRHGCAHT